MFYLDKPNSKSPTFIFVRITVSDGRFKYPVKKKVLPSNFASGRVISDPTRINLSLNRIETIIQTLELQREIGRASWRERVSTDV